MFEGMTQKDYDELREFVDNYKHLPTFMRDFHDQKDVFKTVGSGKSPNPMNPTISVVDGMCYTIDKFLWVMAMHGYTLQKCRAKKPFQDIHESIKAREDKETEMFKQMMEASQIAAEAKKAEEQTNE
jgi:hypothetical protein